MRFVAALVLAGIISFLGVQPANASFEFAFTWGGGAHGGHISDSPTPVRGITDPLVRIQAANWGGLAVDSTGRVYTWASNPDPQASVVGGPTDVVSIGEGGGKPFGA